MCLSKLTELYIKGEFYLMQIISQSHKQIFSKLLSSPTALETHFRNLWWREEGLFIFLFCIFESVSGLSGGLGNVKESARMARERSCGKLTLDPSGGQMPKLALALMWQRLSRLCGAFFVVSSSWSLGSGDISLADHLCLSPPLQLRSPGGVRQTSQAGILGDGSCSATLHCIQWLSFGNIPLFCCPVLVTQAAPTATPIPTSDYHQDSSHHPLISRLFMGEVGSGSVSTKEAPVA